jgi:hypothetical protein
LASRLAGALANRPPGRHAPAMSRWRIGPVGAGPTAHRSVATAPTHHFRHRCQPGPNVSWLDLAASLPPPRTGLQHGLEASMYQQSRKYIEGAWAPAVTPGNVARPDSAYVLAPLPSWRPYPSWHRFRCRFRIRPGTASAVASVSVPSAAPAPASASAPRPHPCLMACAPASRRPRAGLTCQLGKSRVRLSY